MFDSFYYLSLHCAFYDIHFQQKFTIIQSCTSVIFVDSFLQRENGIPVQYTTRIAKFSFRGQSALSTMQFCYAVTWSHMRCCLTKGTMLRLCMCFLHTVHTCELFHRQSLKCQVTHKTSTSFLHTCWSFASCEACSQFRA